MKAPKEKFKAKLGGGDSGDIPLVEVPFDVKSLFGKARAPVVVRFKGIHFRTTIAVYGGKSYIGLRREIREKAGVKIGQTIEFTVEADTEARTVTVPKDLSAALKKAGLMKEWEKLSYTHQKEHVAAVEDAKKPETRARRIQKAVEMLSF